jgi:glycosyltransferase involved in cell wall biosynthesis
MSDEPSPKVSIIIPTLNAGALLDNCLASIAAQDYPRGCLEVILADAFSTDATRDIAKKYDAIVIDDTGRNMEEGKRLALGKAGGDYIVFVDADNEFTHPDYLKHAVRGLETNPQALGVESYYLPSAKMSSFCAYLTHRLHISDPICWLMAEEPILLARAGDVERWTLPVRSFSYPLGANGFVFRRKDLDSVNASEQFQDTHVALHLMKAGKREWLRISGRGVHHYYVQTWFGFLQKRRRAAVHFLRVQEHAPVNWMKEKPPVPTWMAALYCATLVGPAYHSLTGFLRDGDARWLWHLPASAASLLGVVWGIWTYKTRRGDRNLVADLQVKQSLKQNKPGRVPTKSAGPDAPDKENRRKAK